MDHVTEKKGTNSQDDGYPNDEPDHQFSLPPEVVVDALAWVSGHCLTSRLVWVGHEVLSGLRY